MLKSSHPVHLLFYKQKATLTFLARIRYKVKLRKSQMRLVFELDMASPHIDPP